MRKSLVLIVLSLFFLTLFTSCSHGMKRSELKIFKTAIVEACARNFIIVNSDSIKVKNVSEDKNEVIFSMETDNEKKTVIVKKTGDIVYTVTDVESGYFYGTYQDLNDEYVSEHYTLLSDGTYHRIDGGEPAVSINQGSLR